MTRAEQQARERNAALSIGPRTPEGKAASSRNAIRHNLSGTTFVLLPGEDGAAFDALVRDYTGEWNPRTPHETFLVTQMVQARWRLNRIARMEAEVLDAILLQFGEGQSDEGAMLIADRFNPGALDKLHRYAKDAERSYNRAVKDLRAYRAEQAKRSKNQSVPAVEPKIQNEPKRAAATPRDRRSVSAISPDGQPTSKKLGAGHLPLATSSQSRWVILKHTPRQHPGDHSE